MGIKDKKGLKMKRLLMVVCVWLLMAGVSVAQSWEFNLDAGLNSLQAGAHFRKDMGNGYLKAGISGLYTDDDDTEYKWGGLSVAAGNDTIVKGLRCEVGLKGIFGDAEDGRYAGDVGALAFTVHAGYTFPKRIMPLPIEVFTDLTYAPEMLSFQDTKMFTAASLGVGVHIISNASVVLTYTAYDVDMENGPGNWTLDENVIRGGVVLRF
jgi:hypothetical protein